MRTTFGGVVGFVGGRACRNNDNHFICAGVRGNIEIIGKTCTIEVRGGSIGDLDIRNGETGDVAVLSVIPETD